jgi:hypothetical protein
VARRARAKARLADVKPAKIVEIAGEFPDSRCRDGAKINFLQGWPTPRPAKARGALSLS